MSIAIIGGTGVYDPDLLGEPQEEAITTPYGSVALMTGSFQGQRLLFLNRHGSGHTVPPHRVNYRANVWALRAAGVTRVIGTAAVGSLNLAYAPGHMVLLDQFMDFTKSRPATFFDDQVVHTDLTHPYCADLRTHLHDAARKLDLITHPRGCYVATEGPRFETPAEIRAFRILGGDVVGMTNVPEVVLARELGLCYATVALVTNYAAGLTSESLSHAEVVAAVAAQEADLRLLLRETLSGLAEVCPLCGPPAPTDHSI